MLKSHVKQNLARLYADLCEPYMSLPSISINLLKNIILESGKQIKTYGIKPGSFFETAKIARNTET